MSRAFRTPRPSRRRAVVRRIASAAATVVGAELGMRLGGRAKVALGPATVRTRVSYSVRDGGTVVNVPPAGQIGLETHRGMLRLDATVVGIDEHQVRDIAESADPRDAALDGLSQDARAAAISLGSRAILSSVGGAAAVGGLVGRSARDAMTGAALAAGVLGANAGYAWRTKNLQSWRDPRLTGLLQRVPSLIGEIEQIPQQLERYRKQIGEITASVSGLYQRLTSLPQGSNSDTTSLVWVSDIHNNPIAFDVVRALVDQYDAAMVIDSGDINDWGSAFESKTFADIKRISVPYVFVKGNHDGPGTLSELQKFDNVVILQNRKPTVIAGIRLVGEADPRFTPDKASGDDHFSRDRLREIGREFAAAIDDVNADIAVLHDPESAAELAGAVPLALSGHTHRRLARVNDGTTVLTQGSSGGVGLRGIRSDPPKPLEISVLHLDTDTARLRTIDDYTIGGLGLTEVSLVRRGAAELSTGSAVSASESP